MNGVIYARYSEGPRQTDQSIEGQVADCRTYAAREGIRIVGVYADAVDKLVAMKMKGGAR